MVDKIDTSSLVYRNMTAKVVQNDGQDRWKHFCYKVCGLITAMVLQDGGLDRQKQTFYKACINM